MRPDRMKSLRQRLQREADAFEFDALIAGVSTIGSEEAPDGSQAPGAPPHGPDAPQAPSAPAQPSGQTAAGSVPGREEATPEAPQQRRPARRAASPRSQQPLFMYGDPTEDGAADAGHPIRPDHTAAAHADRRPMSRAADREERLRTVLNTLGGRLLLEAGKMRAAVLQQDADLAGRHLAHINYLLDILQSVDPLGDLARQLGTRAAPPNGRSWPAAAWSAVELAESPLSGLLPPTADGAYYRKVLSAAWGASDPS